MVMEHEDSFFRMLADNSPLFIGMCDMNYKPFYVNDAGRILVGLDDLEHFARIRVQDFFFPEDQRFILEEFFPRVLSEGRAETEIRFRHFKTGAAVWMIYDVFFLRGQNGEPVGLATVSRDITERKLAEKTAADAHALIQSIIDNTPSLVYAFDQDGRFLLANKSVAELLNATPQQLVGRRRLAFMTKQDADWHEANDRKVFEAGTALEFEEHSELKNRSITWLTHKFPLRDSKGQIYGVAGVSTDVSHLKLLEETMRDAEQRKDEFIATLAHELRNPLAPIKNAVYVLEGIHRKDQGDQRGERLIGIIKRQVDHLVRLVDDLLEVTRITTGKFTLRQELVELGAIVHDAIEGSEPLLIAQKHKLELSLSEQPLFLRADPTRLSQVLTNILNNAAKYTPPGGKIVLSTRKRGSEAVISVQDNGIGILPEMQNKIFDLFSQSHRAVGREQGGIGVGLSIARKLVEMQGGRIEVHSEGAGHGSEFVIFLPLADEKSSPMAPEPGLNAHLRRRASNKRVLVIEDEADVAESTAMLLEELGAKARIVHSGCEAPAAIEAFDPHIVLLDLGMSELDGFETARLIRRSAKGRHLKLVALTGWGQEKDRAKTLEAGFDSHLTKPASIEHLEALLESQP
jgi:PAS domain S-box-containing protein